MIRRKTVFVVGAGASKEIGLPIGSELTADISTLLDIRFSMGIQKLSGDDTVYNALRYIAQNEKIDVNEYLHACWNLRDAMVLTRSIDTYVDTHRDNKLVKICSKLAIAQAISKYELNSGLSIRQDSSNNNTIDFRNISNTWYRKIWNTLQSGVRQDEVGKMFENIAFIVFNPSYSR